MKPIVSIIMGSDSDLPVMQEASQVLEEFQIPHEVKIVSAHRTPQAMFQFATNAHLEGIRVIIAGAGGAAHLPGMVASLTPLPVIGVPVKGKSLEGMDSLYSIVQMPPGVPVATVAINGAKNAGLLAVQILAASDPSLLERISQYKGQLREMVEKKTALLEEKGVHRYLKEEMNR